MVGEATIDAYEDAGQEGGFFTMIEERLHVSFFTTVVGVEGLVKMIDRTDADEIVAVCHPERDKQRISILELPLSPSAPPEGAEWIAAYRYWQRGGR